MNQTTLKDAMHEVAEVKILKAQIVNCKAYIGNTFGKTEDDLDSARANLVVLVDHFGDRKDKIMGYMKTASVDDKAKVFKSMKEA